MVTRNNRGRSAGDLKNRLKAAALRLFRERGYARTSVDAVVLDAGTAKGTFFNFFPTKLDVLKTYYKEVDVEIGGGRARLDPARPKAALIRYARDVEAILRREGGLMKELLTLISTEPSLRRLDDDSGAEDARQLREFLSRARSAGTLRARGPLNDVVATLMDLWSGAVREWVQSGQEKSLAALYARRLGLLNVFDVPRGRA